MGYAKPPFSGPEAVLAYLSRYTHRVAISNRRLMAFDETGVTFRYKDYRRDGPERQRVMTLARTNSSAASCSMSCHMASTDPPLRLARQFRAQGQYHARPRTTCRGTPTGARRSAGTTRLAATLSLLRRAHDHHRDLRAMEATTRATSLARINREHPVVTRHRFSLTSRRNTSVTANAPGTPFAKISVNVVHSGRRRIPILAWSGKKSHSPGARRFPRRTVRRHHNRAKREIPIDRRRNPAVSCLGGFRTPAPCPDAPQ